MVDPKTIVIISEQLFRTPREVAVLIYLVVMGVPIQHLTFVGAVPKAPFRHDLPHSMLLRANGIVLQQEPIAKVACG